MSWISRRAICNKAHFFLAQVKASVNHVVNGEKGKLSLLQWRNVRPFKQLDCVPRQKRTSQTLTQHLESCLLTDEILFSYLKSCQIVYIPTDTGLMDR